MSSHSQTANSSILPTSSPSATKKATSLSNSANHSLPTYPLRSLSIKRGSSTERDQDVEAEAIKARIRGWSISKTGYESQVTAKEVGVTRLDTGSERDEESESVRRILSKASGESGGEGLSDGEVQAQVHSGGGVLKTVVYDVKFSD
jgi:hypothetical protein